MHAPRFFPHSARQWRQVEIIRMKLIYLERLDQPSMPPVAHRSLPLTPEVNGRSQKVVSLVVAQAWEVLVPHANASQGSWTIAVQLVATPIRRKLVAVL